MQLIALLLFLFVCSAPAADRQLVYHLLSDRHDADLDYELLERLGQQERSAAKQATAEKLPAGGYTMFVSGSDLEPLFTQPASGRFRVLTFCALEVGRHVEPIGGRVDFIMHHLLVLKVSSERRVIDGFYFMREWAEPPMLQLLLRLHSKNRHLAKDMALTRADFRQLGGDPPAYLDPTGRLDNLLNFKEAF